MTHSLKKQIEKIFETSFDPSISQVVRPKICVNLPVQKVSSSDTIDQTSIKLEIPKTDLVEILSHDCIGKLVRRTLSP